MCWAYWIVNALHINLLDYHISDPRYDDIIVPHIRYEKIENREVKDFV